MSSQQLNEWMLYFSMEPFGDELLDTHLATLTAILYNSNRPKGGKEQTVKAYKQWQAVSNPFDPQAFFDRLKGWAIVAGAEKKEPIDE